MKTVHEIAQGLALEIKERFGFDSTITPGMAYDLSKRGEERSLGKVTSDFINSYTVKTDKFIITVKVDTLRLSIATDVTKDFSSSIDGLPGIIIGMTNSPNSKAYDFELADPSSIESLLNKIAEPDADDDEQGEQVQSVSINLSFELNEDEISEDGPVAER